TAGGIAAALFSRISCNDPPIARTTFVNAELIKLGVNTFVTARISFANMLSQICDGLPGADAAVVSSVLGLDRRIGRGYLHGGLPYGGPCFPRDNRALAATADDLGVLTDLPGAIDRVNQMAQSWLIEFVRRHIRPGLNVGILGLSYKVETDVVEASTGVALAN